MAGRRAAEWRFPTEKQQRAEETARRLADAQQQRDQVSEHDCWWASVLSDPRASTSRPSPARRLAEIRADLLRVECLRCLRCFRIVEIARTEAVRLFGGDTTWKDAGRRLLDDGCQHRTGRHEEDGCWPDFR